MSSKKKKILIIGSCGNIGRELCLQYLKKKFLVEGISLNRKSTIKNCENFRNFNFNYRDNKILRKFLKKKYYDLVINLIIYNKKQAIRDYNFFKNIVSRYIFISSVSLYNSSKKRITELDKAKDLKWPVASNKYFAEKALLKFYKKNNFPLIIIRAGHVYNYFTIPSNLIGFGENLIKILELKKTVLLFSKKTKRSLMHSQDFSRALVALSTTTKKISGEIFNICSDKVITWEKLFLTYCKILKIKVKFQYIKKERLKKIDKKIYYAIVGDRIKSTRFNLNKLKKYVPNFKEKISVLNGLRKVIINSKKNSLDKTRFKKFFKIYNKLLNLKY